MKINKTIFNPEFKKNVVFEIKWPYLQNFDRIFKLIFDSMNNNNNNNIFMYFLRIQQFGKI